MQQHTDHHSPSSCIDKNDPPRTQSWLPLPCDVRAMMSSDRFVTSYAWQALDELPAGDIRHFPPDRRAGQAGLLVEVRPENAPPWVGMFAFGTASRTPSTHSEICPTPDPDRLCVVARGAGYLVSAHHPKSWEPVASVPITDVRSVPRAGVLVLATYTDLFAYDASGIAWRTPRLAWDGLHIDRVTDTEVHGTYFDIQTEAPRAFTVDLRTGLASGGVES